jgi:hypothetical protein
MLDEVFDPGVQAAHVCCYGQSGHDAAAPLIPRLTLAV